MTSNAGSDGTLRTYYMKNMWLESLSFKLACALRRKSWIDAWILYEFIWNVLYYFVLTCCALISQKGRKKLKWC